MSRPTIPINLTPAQNESLQKIIRRREIPHSIVQRAQIILKAAVGDNNKKISQDLGLCFDARWSLEATLGKGSDRFINRN